mgnify:CR=1 FL=1|tara:strand:+ start:226 stop:699 length:474 start_codon:yes stop_codon:yes gene_type:complete
MIEVLALASAVSTIAGSISNAVKAGRDVGAVLPAFGKLAKLEADINLAEKGKHKGPLGRLTSTEAEGFAIAQAKMAHKQAIEDLRSVCRLYGPPGMWDTVVREQAAARTRRKNALEEQAKQRDRIFYTLSLCLGVSIFLFGVAGLFWGAAIIADNQK